ncbi:MAG: EpsG family protein, partial [Oscillospiraceae bacterium]|nr:EpsG family protein [Oscillospiraceae bacterium]
MSRFFNDAGEQQKEEETESGTVIRYTPFFATLVFLPVIIMAVWGPPRSDTYLYLQIYRTLPAKLAEGFRKAFSSKGPAFTMLGIFVKTVFGSNPTIYRLVLALIHAIPVITVFRRYSDDYLLSIFLFLCQGIHLAWMMNGIRQFVAVTIIFAATPWLIEKQYVNVILVILVASTFHRTALFMLLVVFVVQGKAWNMRTLIFIALTIVATLIFSRNGSVFDSILDLAGYSIQAAKEFGDDGANPVRVLITMAPLVLAYFSRDILEEEYDGMLNICVNMCVISTGTMLVATVTSGIMVGRMEIYTSLYSMILLPHLIDVYFVENNKTVVKFIAAILYFILFCVERGFLC